MKYLINQWVEYDSVDKSYTYTPWYHGKDMWGGRAVGERVLERIKVPSYLGIAWRDWATNTVVMYPKPLHLVARLVRNCYWAFLKPFYWVGLIDTAMNECFRWQDFYRVQSH